MTLVLEDHNEDVTLLRPELEALNLPGHYNVSNNGMRLFRIPELLESILLHLPTRDILLAQSVNRHFKQVIDSSREIQRALFFQAAPFEPRQPTERTLNLLLAVRGTPRSMIVIHGQANPCVMSLSATWILQDRRFRPTAAAEADRSVVAGYRAHVLVKMLCDPTKINAKDLSDAKCYSTGSWRRTYVTQPPCAVTCEVVHGPRYKNTICKAVRLGEMWSEYVYSNEEPRIVGYFAERLRLCEGSSSDGRTRTR